MSRYPASVRPLARQEVLNFASYIAERNQSYDKSYELLEAFDATVRQIGEAPERWPLSRHRARGDDTLRQRSIPGFPNHLVFYRFDGQRVTVVRVLHGSRDLAIQLLGERS